MQFDLRRLDIYRKIPKDLTQPTYTGAVISISSTIFIIFLFISELSSFLTTDVVSELTVDDPVSKKDDIPVFINISLPRIKCQYIGLDIQDDMGRHDVGYVENAKVEINNGKGCLYTSSFDIKKVPGNFHVSTHAADNQPDVIDMAHIIHKIRFGVERNDTSNIKGSFNPLENVDRMNADSSATYDYVLRIVPTVYENLNKQISYPFQYTYSSRTILHSHGGMSMPTIWFRYDLSPITVRYHEKRKPVYSFLTTVCAIIGGTFTVASIIDSCIFTASELFKKAELGKLT